MDGWDAPLFTMTTRGGKNKGRRRGVRENGETGESITISFRFFLLPIDNGIFRIF